MSQFVNKDPSAHQPPNMHLSFSQYEVVEADEAPLVAPATSEPRRANTTESAARFNIRSPQVMTVHVTVARCERLQQGRQLNFVHDCEMKFSPEAHPVQDENRQQRTRLATLRPAVYVGSRMIGFRVLIHPDRLTVFSPNPVHRLSATRTASTESN